VLDSVCCVAPLPIVVKEKGNRKSRGGKKGEKKKLGGTKNFFWPRRGKVSTTFWSSKVETTRSPIEGKRKVPKSEKVSSRRSRKRKFCYLAGKKKLFRTQRKREKKGSKTLRVIEKRIRRCNRNLAPIR